MNKWIKVNDLFYKNYRAAGGIGSLVLMAMSMVNMGLNQGASMGIRWFCAIFSPIAFTQGVTSMLILIKYK